ncbi:MAG: alpha/beta hydrolase [Clostridia bacterium]|nr:alpha/beta hydrolase [Clostridia bacterium]
MKTFNLWETLPEKKQGNTVIEYYPAKNKVTDATVIVFPGGGYHHRAPHEGQGYAEFLNNNGMDAFVCQYAVNPELYPLPLLDARRAVQFVRKNAEEFGIDPKKIGVMGSSAGGHLVASLSTVLDFFPEALTAPDETDALDYIPDFQILCYPVISLLPDFGHTGSGDNLLGNNDFENPLRKYLAPHKLVHDKTPPAFIWHTMEDGAVPVENSFHYASALHKKGIDGEVHVFPFGPHGLGLAEKIPHTAQWSGLLIHWLKMKNFL